MVRLGSAWDGLGGVRSGSAGCDQARCGATGSGVVRFGWVRRGFGWVRRGKVSFGLAGHGGDPAGFGKVRRGGDGLGLVWIRVSPACVGNTKEKTPGDQSGGLLALLSTFTEMSGEQSTPRCGANNPVGRELVLALELLDGTPRLLVEVRVDLQVVAVMVKRSL